MEKRERHLIVCGRYADAFLSSYRNELSFDSCIVVNDLFEGIYPQNTEFIYFKEYKHFSSLIARRKMPEILKEVLKTLRGDIICFAALGHGSGTGIYRAIGNFFRTLNEPERLKFVSIRPWETEGDYAVSQANEAVLEHTDMFIQMSLSISKVKQYMNARNIEEAYQVADKWAVKMLQVL
ncbi:hypothetical protein [Algoriphagus ornithinivorans]|uniref:hypothetical protein n=1 Tax=Algoriphagus ornithinivorans TaxID=226506 RepID=UPI000B856507|nr:hypothetical protein [Algoriphagus ornithinivorans]